MRCATILRTIFEVINKNKTTCGCNKGMKIPHTYFQDTVIETHMTISKLHLLYLVKECSIDRKMTLEALLK